MDIKRHLMAAHGAVTKRLGRTRFARDPRAAVTLALIVAVAAAVIAIELDKTRWRIPNVVLEADATPTAPSQVLGKAASDMIADATAKPAGVTVVPASANELSRDFRLIGYRLEDVRRGDERVPRVFVRAMPRDLRQVDSVATKKSVFIKTMLPLILQANEELRVRRQRIKALTARAAKGRALSADDAAWLDAQYQRYHVEPGDAQLLLRRADMVPPSLALAQAAEESGWGTSRFALEGHALFGQRTHAAASGLVPAAHAETAAVKVKSFAHLLDGVRSYLRNLNTHRAYVTFRKRRAGMRAASHGAAAFDPMELAEALDSYSERGEAYIETIKTIIRVNSLDDFDGAQLSDNLDLAQPFPRA